MVEKAEPNKESMKILLVGEQAVGKSSLMCRYVENIFNFNMMGTAGLDLKKKKVTINNQEITVYIYDSAGQERFRKIGHNQYKNVQGVLIVYDVTDRNSFECVGSWIESLYKCGGKDKEIIIIGNKIDLKDDRVVDYEEGEKLAEQFHSPFIETSAKDSTNVEEGFLKIINNIYKKQGTVSTHNEESKEEVRKKPKPSGCCYAAS